MSVILKSTAVIVFTITYWQQLQSDQPTAHYIIPNLSLVKIQNQRHHVVRKMVTREAVNCQKKTQKQKVSVFEEN